MVENLREKGTFKGGRNGTSRTVRTQASIKDVEDSVARSPKKSIRRRSQSPRLTRRTMHNILKQDLHLRPYRVQICHLLKTSDMKRRMQMVDWFKRHPDVFKDLWFSDEAHFSLSRHVNSHNAVHWGSHRPEEVQTMPHSKKVMVWELGAMKHGGCSIAPSFSKATRERQSP